MLRVFQMCNTTVNCNKGGSKWLLADGSGNFRNRPWLTCTCCACLHSIEIFNAVQVAYASSAESNVYTILSLLTLLVCIWDVVRRSSLTVLTDIRHMLLV